MAPPIHSSIPQVFQGVLPPLFSPDNHGVRTLAQMVRVQFNSCRTFLAQLVAGLARKTRWSRTIYFPQWFERTWPDVVLPTSACKHARTFFPNAITWFAVTALPCVSALNWLRAGNNSNLIYSHCRFVWILSVILFAIRTFRWCLPPLLSHLETCRGTLCFDPRQGSHWAGSSKVARWTECKDIGCYRWQVFSLCPIWSTWHFAQALGSWVLEIWEPTDFLLP